MKKILLLSCLLISIGSVAQESVRKHHVEAGAGLAIPAEFIVTDAIKETNTLSVYGEYRYDLTPSVSVGAVYSFVLPHDIDIAFIDKTRFHTLNALVEYKFGTFGPMSMYIGGGAGVQYRKVHYTVMTSTSEDFFSGDISLHLTMELFDHLRLTFGHYHDLHYPLSFLSSGAPYYHLSVGWGF